MTIDRQPDPLPVLLDPVARPRCPHCERDLDDVAARQIGLPFGKAYVVFCPACRKVLGTTHRKGFWMG